MDGPGIITYPGYRYHGKFERNLPKGPGCYIFSEKYMQHGFYVNLRDPAFDYVGADELSLDDTAEKGKMLIVSLNFIDTIFTDEENRGNPPGIVPIWRARSITLFKEELLPPAPSPLPVKESLDSLIDIIEYLQEQYAITDYVPEGAEYPPPPSPELVIKDQDDPVSNAGSPQEKIPPSPADEKI